MNEGEMYEFVFVLVGAGIVLLPYYPKVFASAIPYVALLGAFYLVWGTFSRVVSGILGLRTARRDDWWAGMGILLVVGLFFGKMDLAVGSIHATVRIILSIPYWLISGLVSLLG